MVKLTNKFFKSPQRDCSPYRAEGLLTEYDSELIKYKIWNGTGTGKNEWTGRGSNL